ncbi:MAG: hypothetical protein JST48_06780 [Bacteroidetes bacterium]|nr:hypothetical protein [Bacteroidota bacterium]
MKGLALSSLRVGKKYRLVNFDETYEFVIERALFNYDFEAKDLFTMERYKIKDLFKFGKGKDFEILEIS